MDRICCKTTECIKFYMTYKPMQQPLFSVDLIHFTKGNYYEMCHIKWNGKHIDWHRHNIHRLELNDFIYNWLNFEMYWIYLYYFKFSHILIKRKFYSIGNPYWNKNPIYIYNICECCIVKVWTRESSLQSILAIVFLVFFL